MPRGRPKVVQSTHMQDIKTSLARLEEKVENIQKVSIQNQQEIKSLRTQVAMGKGGLKVLLWLGGIIGTVLAMMQGWFNFKGGSMPHLYELNPQLKTKKVYKKKSNIEKAEDTLPSDVEPQTAMPKKRGRKSKEKAAE